MHADGRSAPNKSLISVWSDKLIRTKLLPVICANVTTNDVLPTPGAPSSKIGLLFICMALKTFSILHETVLEVRVNWW